MPCFPLLLTVVVTAVVNECWPDSKLSPSLLVRHLEKGNTKLQTMSMPLPLLSHPVLKTVTVFFPQWKEVS